MYQLGPIAFSSPGILLALLLLPALWWLLRITPPAPQIIRFPPVRLLFGLHSEEETPASAPLWLVLLRLTIAALLILALAHPLFNPGGPLGGKGAVMLVVDDGWASAAGWDRRQQAMGVLIDRAERANRPIIMLSTAPGEAGQTPEPSGLMRAAEAKSLAGTLQPKPWPVDRQAAAQSLASMENRDIGLIVWLSNGLQDEGVAALSDGLRHLARLHVLTDPGAFLPPILLPPEAGAVAFEVTARRAASEAMQVARLRAFAADGRVLAGEDLNFAAGAETAKASIDLPVELRNEIVRIEIENAGTAGAIALLDERWRRRPVGIVAASSLNTDLSLLDELYYIERALSPFGEIQRGPLEKMIAANRAAIMLPDGHSLVSTEVRALNRWIRGGGMVVRFAGPRLAEHGDDGLVPVKLRSGGRTLGGAMLWTEPAQLAPFDPKSPFHGLVVPEDVRVSRQILAEPSIELPSKTWARLRDGTPLVTAERRGKGWLVLVHTSGGPDWSNLAMSGLFVEILERTVAMSRGVAGNIGATRSLPPLTVLDGAGRLGDPSPIAIPIEAGAFDQATPGPRTPPGYYGTETERRALNLGPLVGALKPLALADGISSSPYFETAEFDLKPWLLTAALILLLLDGLATLAMRGFARPLAGIAASLVAGFMLLAGAWPSGPAAAQDADIKALEATQSTRLAYVITGQPTIDEISHAGLKGLSLILNRRTAVEAADPMGVNLDRDELAFFPLLYWPITQEQQPLAPETVARLNRYMENGGTILFDTRDGNYGGTGAGPGAQRMRELT
ncbi:MAG: DUF4159 domain-containing protein, partial [Proteobacteria bacterium]|nr:DUF4159 domain-containing protein [Pseudomonadota bacterium]